MKNMKYLILTAFAVISIATSCRQEMPVDFEVDASVIEVGPEGGVRTFCVNADENWTAISPAPWVTVSPSNGHGSVECKVMIDSALSVSPRQTKIRIENQNTSERKEFVIKQGGFPYEIRVDKPQVDVESYASLEKRFFTVKVKSNMQFDITVEGENSDWLKYETPKLVLDREARPREIDVKFSWDVNFNPADRNVKIKFAPKDQQLTASVLESIDVRQFGAEEIVWNLLQKREKIRLLALVDTLEYLKKGGRLSSAAAFAGSVLNIKTVITLTGGEIQVLGKARGSRQANNLLV